MFGRLRRATIGGIVSQTIDKRPPTLEELRARRNEILELAARRGVSNIRVFGSVARGEAGETSDVDLLVDIDPGRSLFDLAGFYADVKDLLGCEVDVGTVIKERLLEEIEAELVPL